MKKLYNLTLSLLVLMGTSCYTYAQKIEQALPLGTTQNFLRDVNDQIITSSLQRRSKLAFEAKVSAAKTLTLNVNFKKSESADQLVLVGGVEGVESSNFFLNVDGSTIEGNIVLIKEKKAYKYSSENGNAYLSEVDINKVLCIEYNEGPQEAPSSAPAARLSAQTNLQSLPGAAGCVLLDYDGHYMAAGNYWNNGNPINAAHSGMSDAAILESWEIVAEDFRPFNLNITTNEAVFNSYPRNRRMRCVITPTNTAAPGAGGVAYIGSFNWDNDVPCWTFMLGAKSSAEASSHEIGHTFDLGHDGRNNPAEGYFAGHGDWATIMGVGYYRNIAQWSKGEYNSANNLEDDLAKISGTKFGVGYRNDDHGNGTSNATVIASGNNVNRSGLIERTSDVDYFRINSGAGTISLNVNTIYRHSNLDVIVRLHNSSGAVIGTYNPAGLNASFNANVSAGTYYVSVDGTGAGNPATDGYSDYGSLGNYTITGSIPVQTTPPPVGDAIVTVYKDCNFGGTAIGLPEGDYTISQLQAMGVMNDDISSFKIKYGYKIGLYADDNFGGASVVLNTDDACLVDNNFNDIVTSVRIRTDGITNLAGTYHIQNRNSNLYMDVWGASTSDGGEIKQGGFHGGSNQQFEFTHLGDGAYKIIAKNSGKSFDISGISKDNFAKLIQWNYVGGNNQKFIIKDAGNGYYKLVAKHSSRIIEVGFASTANGATINQYDNNNQTCGMWKMVPVTTAPSALLIQAEAFSAMSGVEVEGTQDVDGVQNVGWIDTGDWLAYNSINFPTSGTYKVEYRVASMNGGKLSLDLNAGSIQLGALDVPATGGWQTWRTISHNVNVNAGTYNLGIYAQAGGWNINWIRITRQASASASVARANTATILESTFEFYPNPAENTLSVKSEIQLAGGVARVYDAVGSLVLSADVEAETVDVSSLNSGMYTIVISVDGNQVARRFVKK